MKSLRNQDMRAEEKLAEFMDAYFYSKLKSRNGNDLFFERKKDKESQLQGVDVIIETEKGMMLIDEKASLYYSNAMIPTFAFELDSIQDGNPEPVQGWFVNDNLETEYYMLIWPNIKCEIKEKQWVRKDIAKLQKDDFTIIEAFLVPKKSIRIELEKYGYDKRRLLAYSKAFRVKCTDKGDRQEEKINDDIKIMFSGQLAEKPINVVIKKNILRDLAKGIYLISADGYATLKGE